MFTDTIVALEETQHKRWGMWDVKQPQGLQDGTKAHRMWKQTHTRKKEWMYA